MRRAGIGGLLFMDGDMGNPKGPHRFMSESCARCSSTWSSEADRLGLKINLNNDPGWAGSGGAWVKPEQASQKVVNSETVIQGPAHFDAVLAQPSTTRDFYRDIVVLACPAPAADAAGKFRRIEDVNSTKSFAGGQDFAGCVPWPRFIPTKPQWPTVPGPQCIASAKVQDLTAPDGPAADGSSGTFRPGVGSSLGSDIRWRAAARELAQPEAAGLECDKLSKSAIEAHFAAMVEKLAGGRGTAGRQDAGLDARGQLGGGLRELDGRLSRGVPPPARLRPAALSCPRSMAWSSTAWKCPSDSCGIIARRSARCSWRTTPGTCGSLPSRRGCRLSIEAYDGTCDDLRYAGRADEPMCEFWQRGCYTGLPLCDIVEEMASAAHVYGKPHPSAPRRSPTGGAISSTIPRRSSRWATGRSAPG